MNKAVYLLVSILLALAVLLPACSSTPTPSPSEIARIDNLRLVGTIGPLSLPLAYMVEKNSLASVARQTTLTVWANPTQLQAIMAGGQGDFVSLPTTSAATFYNRGISLQLLDCSIWNILYLVSSDSNIRSMADLKGKRVVAPYQGAIPDAMFKYLCLKQGWNPDKVTDIEIFYAADPVQASQLLLTGQEKYVLLSEPSATSVILKAQASGTPLYRVLNMQTEWGKTGGGASTPIAGTVVMGDLKNRPEVVNIFLSEYQKAVDWMLKNPQEAGQIGARVLTEQGFTAAALTESMKSINWQFTGADKARPDIENFFKALTELSPNYIGGKLPDAAFYYEH
jgi:NitT/TauT family transport system substrate-binding protein